MKKKLSKIQFALIILVISIVVSLPILEENLNVYFDDGSQHISRAYSSYLSITNGKILQFFLI